MCEICNDYWRMGRASAVTEGVSYRVQKVKSGILQVCSFSRGPVGSDDGDCPHCGQPLDDNDLTNTSGNGPGGSTDIHEEENGREPMSSSGRWPENQPATRAYVSRALDGYTDTDPMTRAAFLSSPVAKGEADIDADDGGRMIRRAIRAEEAIARAEEDLTAASFREGGARADRPEVDDGDFTSLSPDLRHRYLVWQRAADAKRDTEDELARVRMAGRRDLDTVRRRSSPGRRWTGGRCRTSSSPWRNSPSATPSGRWSRTGAAAPAGRGRTSRVEHAHRAPARDAARRRAAPRSPVPSGATRTSRTSPAGSATASGIPSGPCRSTAHWHGGSMTEEKPR